MSLTVLGGITFVLVFAGSILLHEFGHFIVARLVGIEVEEFGVGIPPRMLTLFTWKGTKFTLNWLPLGGFNRMKGEDNPETKGGFMDAKPWARITTLLAGSAMNILTAILAFSIYFTQIGIPNYSKVQILDVSPGSPAMQAGIQVNDVVISAGGQEITDTYQLSNIIRENLDQPLALVIMRGDTTINLDVIPDSNRSIQEGATGMLLGSMLEPAKSWFATIPISFQATFQTGRELLSLTLSLGIINLLPIPALDGGRIFFILLEVIFRKRVPARFESMIHGITFVILISVLGYFYIMDFIHPVSIILP